MNIKHYTVPEEAFPRYRYARDHVTPLLKRSGIVIKQCALEDPFPISDLKEVHIYIISENETNLIARDELTRKECKEIKYEEFHRMDPGDFKKHTVEQFYICVSTCEQADKLGTQMWQYFGQFVFLFSNENDTPKSPDVRGCDDSIVCVKPKSCFAVETDFMLERMVFRYLYPRVKVLYSFLHVEPMPLVFASINQSIEIALSSKMKMKSMRSSKKNDETGLYRAWHEARLEVITSKVNEVYGKDDSRIKGQILQPPKQIASAVDPRPSTICEHILPYLAYETGPGQKLPDPLLAKVNDLHHAADVQRKTDFIEAKFIKNLNCISDNKEQIEELFDECMSMYRRSKVPDFERPRPTKLKSVRLEESVANEIRNVKGVTGCGYRFSVLDIYLIDSLTELDRKKSESELKNIIERNKIERFKLRYEQKLKKLYSVGSKVKGKHGGSASLGGFAKRGQDKKLSLLLARHFAALGSTISVETNTGIEQQIAEVLQPVRQTENIQLDISAAEVIHSVVETCSTKFRSRYGDATDSCLMHFEENDLDWLAGLPVHIWGAATSPGLGKVIIPDYYVEGMDSVRFVKIEDRHQDESTLPFAKEGDSGSIICADDPSGDFVHVISMLMGGMLNSGEAVENGQYLTFRLEDGLQQLQQEHDEEFQLC